MGAIPQLAVSTVLLGGIYALIAVGLTLIFGIMRVVNFAHGEFLMLGMYLAFWTFTLWGLDPYVVLLVAVPLFFVVGLAVYALVIKGVVKASHNVQIFTTVGLSTALQNAGARPVDGRLPLRAAPGTPRWCCGSASAAFNLSQVVAFAVAVLFTLALFAFMKWTHAGRVMRATAQDGEAATLMGIDTDRVYRLAFAIGIACVGVAGVLVSPLYSVYPDGGAPVRAARLRRRGAGRPRRHGGRAPRQPHRGRRSRCIGSYVFGTRLEGESSTSCSSSPCSSSAPPDSSASAAPRPSAPDVTCTSAGRIARRRFGRSSCARRAGVPLVDLRDGFFLDSLDPRS